MAEPDPAILSDIQQAHLAVKTAEAAAKDASTYRRDLIAKARDQGHTVRAIAQQLGVSQTRIYQMSNPKYR